LISKQADLTEAINVIVVIKQEGEMHQAEPRPVLGLETRWSGAWKLAWSEVWLEKRGCVRGGSEAATNSRGD